MVTRNLTIRGPEAIERENLDRETTVNGLNDYGAEGWELVSLLPTGAEWLAIFKRPELQVTLPDPEGWTPQLDAPGPWIRG